MAAGTDDRTYVLAIDLGTGGPKIALVSTRGEVVAHTIRRNSLVLLPPEGVEQDPEEWWSTIRDGSRELLGSGTVDPADVAAISISAQWMGTVPVDAQGRHLSNALIWMDSRGAPYVKRQVRGPGPLNVQGYDPRKLKTWVQVTGGIPSLAGKDPVGHILWFAHERPDVYAAAHKLLDVPDYLNMRLTGRAATSHDVAVGLWASDNRDLSDVRWVPGLAEWGGFDLHKLPELLVPGSVVGTVLPEVAADWGLGEHVKVITGCGDTSGAGIGSGAVRDGEGHIYVGTSSWVSCHVPYKKTDVLSNITSLPSAIPGRYWVATEQDTAGKTLQWLIDNLLYPDDGLGGPAPDDVFDRLNEVAAKVPAGSNGVIFTPWLNGERTPVDDHRIRAGYHHLGLSTTRADLVRATFEGVALNTRWMMEAAEKFTKQRFPHLRFIGGGASSPLWCQIMADVLDRPILQVKDPRFAVVRGAGLAGAVALGHLRWQDIPDLVEVEARYTPDPSTRGVHDRHFGAFVELYKRNKGIHGRLTRAHD